MDLGRSGRWCHSDEVPEKVESPGETRAIGILLKQHYYSMPLVLVAYLGSELLSVLFKLF